MLAGCGAGIRVPYDHRVSTAQETDTLAEAETLMGPTVVVGPSERHGRGVFAAREFQAGDLIEVCPAILLSAEDHERLDDTPLYGYLFECEGTSAVAFGCGSFYNHSADPSADYEFDDEDSVIRMYARHHIAQGDEITICYAAEADLWFDPAQEPGR